MSLLAFDSLKSSFVDKPFVFAQSFELFGRTPCTNVRRLLGIRMRPDTLSFCSWDDATSAILP